MALAVGVVRGKKIGMGNRLIIMRVRRTRPRGDLDEGGFRVIVV